MRLRIKLHLRFTLTLTIAIASAIPGLFSGCTLDFAALEGNRGQGGVGATTSPGNVFGGTGGNPGTGKPAAMGSGGRSGGGLVADATGGSPADGGATGGGVVLGPGEMTGAGASGTLAIGTGTESGSVGAGTGGMEGALLGGAGGSSASGGGPGGAGTGGGAAGVGGAGTGTAGSGVAGSAGGATGVDLAKYNFELSTQAWGTAAGSPGDFTSVTVSTAHYFAGRSALAASVSAPAVARHFILEVTPPTSAIPGGASVTFHVYVPRSAVLTAVVPYVLENTTFIFTGPIIQAANLTRDGWTTIRVAVPANAMPILKMGVRFESSGAWTDTLYLDSIDW